jgi:hypothetical protein
VSKKIISNIYIKKNWKKEKEKDPPKKYKNIKEFTLKEKEKKRHCFLQTAMFK